MEVRGEWLLCDDGTVRPVIRGEVQTGDGSWLHVPFLLDTGADATVLDADTLTTLGLTTAPSGMRLGGVGGVVSSVLVTTVIRLSREDGVPIHLRGRYAAFTDLDALDMSVLGRDILNLFAVVVDHPGGSILLLRDRHAYRVERR